MNRVWSTVRGYILWSYERGTLQYDVMVTLILLFVFLGPYWINFKDKPVGPSPHQTQLVVSADGRGGLVYEVNAAVVPGTRDDEIRSELLRIIEPISGPVQIKRYEAIRDASGRSLTYKVWAERAALPK